MALMTSRRADEFARQVDTGDRNDDPVSAPLLAVVDALTAVPAAPAPRAEFKAALRQRLVAVAAVQAAAPPVESPLTRIREAGSTWRVQRRLVAAGAAAAAVTAVVGVGVGASRSLPGQPFYGVKRATEAMQLATTFGTEDRGKRHLEFARQRLAEITALSRSSTIVGSMSAQRALAARFVADGSNSSLIMNTLHDMDVETRAGANDMFVAFRDSGSSEPLHALSSFTSRQYGQLHALIDALPASVQPQAVSSLSLLNLVARDTVALASVATAPGGPNQSPTPTVSSSSTSSPGSTPSETPSTTGSGSGSPSNKPTSKTSLPAVTPPSVPSIPPGQVFPTGPLPTAVPSLPDVTGLDGH